MITWRVFGLVLLFSLAAFTASSKEQEKWPKGAPPPAAQSAYALIRLSDGKIIGGQNEQRPQMLASTSKLLSLYYSLKILGPDFRFPTRLWARGKKKNGTLSGALILQGSGDPYLTSAHLMALALNLKNKGIKKVEGDFLVDLEQLPARPRLSPLGRANQADNPSLSALNVEFNRFTALPEQKKTLPPLDFLQIEPLPQELASAQGFSFQASRDQEVWKLAPGISGRTDLPTRSSGLFAGHYFRHLASLLQISLPAPKRGAKNKKDRLVGEHQGPTLLRLTALALEYSNNLMAEMPALQAARKIKGSRPSFSESAKLMKSWLQKEFNELNWKGSSFLNASGLSEKNQLSAVTLARFLAAIYDHEFQGRAFLSLLSAAGRSGPLAQRFPSPEIMYRVWAKTGSLYFVNNLAGVLIGQSGELYAFAILTQGQKKRKQLSAAKGAQAASLRRQAKAWGAKSTSAIHRLVRHWVQTL